MAIVVDPQTVIVAVLGGLASALATGGFASWNLGRTIKSQGDQTRLTLDHQAEQTRITIGHQADMERRKDERALRSAKRERLAASYAPVLTAANLMNDVLIEEDIHPEGETSEQRRARLAPSWQAAMGEARRAQVALALEADTRGVLALYREIGQAFERARTARSLELWDKMHEERGRLPGLIQQLESTIRAHLREFDVPL
jgi:hypothetical protein